MRLIRPQSANEGMMAEKGSIGRAAVMPTSGAARLLRARDVPSPDRLSIVVSRTGSRDLRVSVRVFRQRLSARGFLPSGSGKQSFGLFVPGIIEADLVNPPYMWQTPCFLTRSGL